MKTTIKARKPGNGMLAKLFQQVTMLFESPEKKQFRRLKEYLAA